MYCKNCGQQIDERNIYCPYCGTKTSIKNFSDIDDTPSTGFAILGFFIPLAGIILYLIYNNKRPLRAKSAGKGALIGFITRLIIIILTLILMFIFVEEVTDNISPNTQSTNIDQENSEDILEKKIEYFLKDNTKDIEEIMTNYVDITFGDFTIKNNGYYDTTSLDVSVRNISNKQYTFIITIEAIDKNGMRLETDMVYADRLNPGQAISLTTFQYVEDNKINEFKNATFKVLDIQYYSY